jgi:hypothetical protein
MEVMLSFTPRPLYHEVRAPGTYWIGGSVDARAGLNTVARIENLIIFSAGNRTHVVHHVA